MAHARAGAFDAEALIQRVIAQTTRTGLTIRSVRELRASTVGGGHLGWMRVQTLVTPAGGFSWSVLEAGGSNRTRDKVFRPVLDGEAESWRAAGRDAAALTPANYVFTALPAAGHGDLRFQLTPRRADSRLVEGVLTVSADGYPLRLEGVLARSPSFWVKSVRIVRHYGRFAGVALPTALETEADVKLVGRAVFSMRYRYDEVNGLAILRPVRTAESNP